MLILKTAAGFLNLLVLMSLALFLPPWTVHYWQAWGFLAVFFIPVVFITIYFLIKDPDLIQRRLKVGPMAEKRLSQKIVQSLASLLFTLLLLIPALDRRFHWSHLPAVLSLAADAAILIAFTIIFFVFKENSYTSAIIEVSGEQKVITTGPYALVRHPMYSGGLLLLFAMPVALGSWWGLLFAPPMLFVILTRLRDEEKMLHQSLPGYGEYCQKVRYRLLPKVW